MPDPGSTDRTRTTPPAMDVRSFVSPTRAEEAPGHLDGLPERIGRYRLLRKIGEGGMGAVYQAEQENPRRLVALKLLLAGVASPRALRRFEFEAQVLGRLQHPGIAQIYEAGMVETSAGTRPYFAMEYVDGRTLLDHALYRKLTARQRIELLIRICEAVEHAHQKGVVHRDLKPANILVDASGQPKILDFGVARMTDTDVQATTLQTEAGQIVGTLAYMSPEQLAANTREIDTRSDVYALGVLGYELVANRMPYDLVGKSIVEVAQIIRLNDPTRLSRVNRTFRGDLEVVFGRALEKEKERRYPSAGELAADLRRHLANRPILARPPSTLYQVRKFVRRNRALTAALALAAAAMVVGTVLSLRFGLIAASERDSARVAGEAARVAAEEARAVTRFLVDMLAAANTRGRGREVRVVEVLDDAARQVAERFAAQPLVRASVENALGQTYLSLGAHAEAERLLKSAYELRRQVLGENHADTATSMYWLGDLLMRMERPAEGLPLTRGAYEIRARLLGPDAEDTLESLSDLGIAQAYANDWDAAEATLRKVLDIRLSSPGFGPKHARTFASMDKLAGILQWRGKMEEAETLLRSALAGRRESAPNHPDLLITLGNIGDLWFNLSRFTDAEAAFREAVELAPRLLGPTHPDVDRYRLGLADTLLKLGQSDAAEAVYREVLSSEAGDEGRHANARLALRQLSRLQQRRGNYDDALRLGDASVAICRDVLGPDAIETGDAWATLGKARFHLRDYATARDAFTEALRIYKATVGEGYVNFAGTLSDLAAALVELGDAAQAERLWSESIRLERARGRKVPLVEDLRSRADCLLGLGRAAEAEPLVREALEIDTALGGGESRRRWFVKAVLGEALYRLGRRDEGQAMLLESVGQLLADPEVGERERAREIGRVVRSYESAGETERATEAERTLGAIIPVRQPTSAATSGP